MKIELEVPASSMGETFVELFKNLSKKKREEIAARVHVVMNLNQLNFN